MKLTCIAAAVAALFLSGCASLDGKIDNRIACTMAKDRAFVISEWGPVGISSKIAEKDREVVCREPAPVILVPVPSAPSSMPKVPL